LHGDNFTLLYVHNVRTSQETQDSTVCYGDSFTLLYVEDVRTSQETHLLTVTEIASLFAFTTDGSEETFAINEESPDH
jgi:hypothetical protein